MARASYQHQFARFLTRRVGMRFVLGKGPSLGFAAAAAVLIISAALSIWNLQAIGTNAQLIDETHEVLDQAHSVLSAMKDAETGQRGYMITGGQDYLAPYNSGREEVDAALAALRKLTETSSDEQHRLVKQMANQVANRLITLSRGIDARTKNGEAAARDFVLMGTGKAQMDALRDTAAALITEQNRLLEARSTNSQVIYSTAIGTTLFATVVGLAMVAIAYFYVAREDANRRRMTEELEQRVVERTAELAVAIDALRISNRELEQFASVASHDLQEPLRKIEAFGDRLKNRAAAALDDSARDYLDRVLSSASRMRSLINDLLSFSRITTRGQQPQRIELGSIAREVVSDLEGRLQEVSGEVKLGWLPALDADPLQMRQLLQNLIGNALKFHKPDVKPVIEVAGSTIESPTLGAACRILVRDNGIGFEEIYLDRIFNVFQRLHGRKEYEGTGMGLAICRRIVERHGGTITARSTSGEGATFIVELPLTSRLGEGSDTQ
jgi:signal transduction histidine kinase